MLSVTLAQKSAAVYASPRALVGLSGSAISKLITANSASAAILRRFHGAPFLLQKIQLSPSTNSSAQLLLSPSSFRLFSSYIDRLIFADGFGGGDVSTVDLENSFLVCGRGSFLAASEDLRFRASLSGFSVEGTGTVAIQSSHGTIHKLSLNKGEEFYIHPRTLVAYSSQNKPSHILLQPEITIENTASSHSPTLAQVLQSWALNSIRRITIDPVKRARLWFIGDKDAFYKLSGPGEFYLSSRPKPRLLGLIGAFAELQNQGNILRDAWKDAKIGSNLKPDDAFLSPSSKLPTFQVSVKHGQVLFEDKKELKQEVSSPLQINDKNETPVESVIVERKEEINPVDEHERETFKDQLLADKLVKVDTKSVPPVLKETSQKGWRKFIFGNKKK